MSESPYAALSQREAERAAISARARGDAEAERAALDRLITLERLAAVIREDTA